MITFLRRYRWPILVVLTAITIAVIRFCVYLQAPAPGADIGNYLTSRNWILGDDPTGTGGNRPPLLGITLISFTWLFGDLRGAHLLGAIISAMPILTGYPLLRRIASPGVALVGIIGLVMYHTLSNMSIWGYLSWWNVTLALAIWHMMLGVIRGEQRGWRHIAIIALAATILAGYDKVGAVNVLALTWLWVVVYHVFFDQRHCKRTMTAMVVMTLAVVPWFVFISSTVEGMQLTFPDVVEDYYLTVLGYLALLGLAWYSLRKTETSIKVLAYVVLCAGMVSGILRSQDMVWATVLVRLKEHYLNMGILLALVPMVQWLTQKAWVLRPQLTYVAGGLFACMFLWQGTMAGVNGTRWYNTMRTHHIEALAYIGDHTTQADVTAVAPMEFGWYLEGLERRNAFETNYATADPLQVRNAYISEQMMTWVQGIDTPVLRVATSDPYPGDALVDARVNIIRVLAPVFLLNRESSRIVADSGDYCLLAEASAETAYDAGRNEIQTVYTCANGMRLSKIIGFDADDVLRVNIRVTATAPVTVILPYSLPPKVRIDPINSTYQKLRINAIYETWYGTAGAEYVAKLYGATWVDSPTPHIVAFGADPSFTLRIQVLSRSPSAVSPTPGHWHVEELARKHNIKHLLLDYVPYGKVHIDTVTPIVFDWLRNDNPLYELVWENKDVIILKVREQE